MFWPLDESMLKKWRPYFKFKFQIFLQPISINYRHIPNKAFHRLQHWNKKAWVLVTCRELHFSIKPSPSQTFILPSSSSLKSPSNHLSLSTISFHIFIIFSFIPFPVSLHSCTLSTPNAVLPLHRISLRTRLSLCYRFWECAGTIHGNNPAFRWGSSPYQNRAIGFSGFTVLNQLVNWLDWWLLIYLFFGKVLALVKNCWRTKHGCDFLCYIISDMR